MDFVERLLVNSLLCSMIVCFATLPNKTISQRTAIMVKQQRAYSDQPIKLTTESFRNLVTNSDVLIDRSMFIKELLEHPEKRIIIACPPKWSKSVNLCMLKSYLQVETDQYGNQVTPINRTFAYKLFVCGRSARFNTTKNFQTSFLISKYKDLTDKYLGQFPVIYVRCRFIEGRNRAEIISCIKSLLRKVYQPHSYLLHELFDPNETNSTKRLQAETDFYRFQAILEGCEEDEDVLTDGIALLCKLMYRQHGKRVFVLIDDYDQPFYKALHSEHFTESDIEYVTNVFKKFINPLLDEHNPYVERVVMSATYQFSDFFAPVTVPDYTLVDNPWIEYFASNAEEQLELCGNLNISERRCHSIIDWYMGYKCAANDTLDFGSPFSPACFFTNRDMKLNLFFKQRFDYLFQLTRIPVLKDILDSLVNDRNVTVRSFNDLRFSVADMRRLKEIAVSDAPGENVTESTIDLALSFLCASGYLTFAKPNATATTATMWVPNRETMTEICRKLKAYYNRVHGLSFSQIESLVQRLRNFISHKSQREFDQLKSHMQSFLADTSLVNCTHLKHTGAYIREVLHDVLNYISMKLRSAWKLTTVVWKEDEVLASYMIGYRDNTAVIIAARYNVTLADTLSLAAQQQSVLARYRRYIRFKTFLAITLYANGTLDMACQKEN